MKIWRYINGQLFIRTTFLKFDVIFLSQFPDIGLILKDSSEVFWLNPNCRFNMKLGLGIQINKRNMTPSKNLSMMPWRQNMAPYWFLCYKDIYIYQHVFLSIHLNSGTFSLQDVLLLTCDLHGFKYRPFILRLFLISFSIW